MCACTCSVLFGCVAFASFYVCVLAPVDLSVCLLTVYCVLFTFYASKHTHIVRTSVCLYTLLQCFFVTVRAGTAYRKI